MAWCGSIANRAGPQSTKPSQSACEIGCADNIDSATDGHPYADLWEEPEDGFCCEASVRDYFLDHFLGVAVGVDLLLRSWDRHPIDEQSLELARHESSA